MPNQTASFNRKLVVTATEPELNAIKELSTEQQRQVFIERVTLAKDAWFAAQCKNPFGEYFLFYLPGQLQMVCAEVSPGADWVKAKDEPLKGDLMPQHVHRYLWDLLVDKPVYPV